MKEEIGVHTRQLLALIALATLAACGGGGSGAEPASPPPSLQVEFLHDGLDERVVRRITQFGDRLFAATDAGLYDKFLGDAGWQLRGFDGSWVQDIAVIDSEHWLATVSISAPDQAVAPRLFETVNGGANWARVTSDFGGSNFADENMYALQYDRDNQSLYATGADALAVSVDTGRTWQLLDGSWASVSLPLEALEVNRARGQVWLGGQNAIEEAVLRRFDIQSGDLERYTQLFPSPSTVKGVTFDPVDPDRVLVSGEGGIVASEDNGGSWRTLIGDVDFRFYFKVALDPANPQVLYTAGWDKNFDDPQPLILEMSTDGGSTWVQHPLGDTNIFGGVWSVHVTTEGVDTVVYLGLYRGGIMTARVTTSSS